MIAALLVAMLMLYRYWRRPTVKSWRELRAFLMGWLPKTEKASDVEEGK